MASLCIAAAHYTVNQEALCTNTGQRFQEYSLHPDMELLMEPALFNSLNCTNQVEELKCCGGSRAAAAAAAAAAAFQWKANNYFRLQLPVSLSIQRPPFEQGAMTQGGNPYLSHSCSSTTTTSGSSRHLTQPTLQMPWSNCYHTVETIFLSRPGRAQCTLNLAGSLSSTPHKYNGHAWYCIRN